MAPHAKIAVLQMNAGIDPANNGRNLVDTIRRPSHVGTTVLFTPEMSGLLDRDGARAARRVHDEDSDDVLAQVRQVAAAAKLSVNLWSLALRGGEDGKLVNRSIVIDASGSIVSRHDKIHLFDFDLPGGESWRGSTRDAAGITPAVVEKPLGRLALCVCYDLRFPALYQSLSAASASVLSVPAAFIVPTGVVHWHVLSRARATKNGAFVAAAQAGLHETDAQLMVTRS